MYHGCAAGLIYGRAGEEEFSDPVVNDPRVVALRGKLNATVDESIHEDAVLATALLVDGRQVEVRVDHAIGSLHKPLSDAQLESKFSSLVTPVLGETGTRAITGQWRTVASLPDIRTLVALCRP